MRRVFALVGGVVSLAVILAVFVGCEENDPRGQEFKIDPSAVTSQSNTDYYVFHAVGGEPPFTWTVSDTNLGYISGNGDAVTYYRTAKAGLNTVIVTDDQHWEADASVTQELESQAQTVEISPSSIILSAPTNTIVLAVSGGTPPYTWSMVTAGGGSVSPTTGLQTVYTRGGATGNYVVRVTDARSQFALATVTQQ